MDLPTGVCVITAETSKQDECGHASENEVSDQLLNEKQQLYLTYMALFIVVGQTVSVSVALSVCQFVCLLSRSNDKNTQDKIFL